MLSNLLTVTGQVATLFLMMAVGFVLGRAGKMTEAGRSQMSYLLLYIVCPCVMVDCFLVERTPALTQEVAVGSAAALACYLLFFAVSLLFFRRQPADARDTLRFAAVYGNIGFMGLPLVQSILGEEALVYGALALLAFNLTSWTLGVLIMGGRAAFSLRRAVLNPGVVGIGLGLLCFLSGRHRGAGGGAVPVPHRLAVPRPGEQGHRLCLRPEHPPGHGGHRYPAR